MIRHLAPRRKVRCPRHPVRVESRVMPIHLRAEPGDYAEAVLLPGDPLRARHIAETFFDNPRQVNGERGMLGFTGTFEGTPISVQSSGMGCPSAAIVVEELTQLGVKRIVRVGTCGGLQADMTLGDLVLAISAVPSDGTMLTYTGGEPHAPTADFELVHAAVHQAKHDGTKLRVGPCVSSSTFYDPDTGRAQRWSDRGVLAVEMEAAILFTIAALRRIQAACLLTVSDIIVEGEFVRITDAELQAAVERMTELAHPRCALEGQELTGRALVIVNPAAQNGAAGRRWPDLAERARQLGLELDAGLHRGARARQRAGRSGSGGRTRARGRTGRGRNRQRGRQRPRAERRGRARARDPALRHRPRHDPHLRHPQAAAARAGALARRPHAHDRPRPRDIPHGRRRGLALVHQHRLLRADGRRGRTRRAHVQAAGRNAVVPVRDAWPRSPPGATSRSASRSTTSRRSSSWPTT